MDTNIIPRDELPIQIPILDAGDKSSLYLMSMGSYRYNRAGNL